MRLIYHPDAEMELIEAAQFYERRISTLGSQFLDAADLAIGEIQNAPERWSVIEADVRRYLMPRFPYALYYRVLSDHIRILAFKHFQAQQPPPRLLARPSPRQNLTNKVRSCETTI